MEPRSIMKTDLSKHRSTLSDIKRSMQSCSSATSCMSRSAMSSWPRPIVSHSSSVSGSTSAMSTSSSSSSSSSSYWPGTAEKHKKQRSLASRGTIVDSQQRTASTVVGPKRPLKGVRVRNSPRDSFCIQRQSETQSIPITNPRKEWKTQ